MVASGGRLGNMSSVLVQIPAQTHPQYGLLSVCSKQGQDTDKTYNNNYSFWFGAVTHHQTRVNNKQRVTWETLLRGVSTLLWDIYSRLSSDIYHMIPTTTTTVILEEHIAARSCVFVQSWKVNGIDPNIYRHILPGRIDISSGRGFGRSWTNVLKLLIKIRISLLLTVRTKGQKLSSFHRWKHISERLQASLGLRYTLNGFSTCASSLKTAKLRSVWWY